MSAKITCFIPFGTKEETEITVGELRKSSLVSSIYIVGDTNGKQINGAEILGKESLSAGKTIQQIAEKSDTPYIFIYTKTSALTLGQLAMERFYQVAEDTKSGLVYANHRAIKGGAVENLPVIDYQEGSLRDDFNFGSVLFCNAKLVNDAVKMWT